MARPDAVGVLRLSRPAAWDDARTGGEDNFLFLAGKTLGLTSPFDPMQFDQWRDERLLTVLR
jgi:hypothetical protein